MSSNIKKRSTSPQKANDKGYLYIMSGAFKGKKLEVITAPGLRPIGSRVKEIFFNWIQFEIAGRDVLDLFAGSGALGLEALSRGCNSLQMHEFNKAVYDKLLNNYRGLNLDQLEKIYGHRAPVTIKLGDSYQYIKQPASKAFNLVFIDPPFMQEQELTILHDLARNGYLADNALVFVQLDAAYKGVMEFLPPKFSHYKYKACGNILLYLLQYQSTNSVSSTEFNIIA